MLVKLPKEVGRIMGTLQQSGFEAYVVGECISDSLAGKSLSDGISPPMPDLQT